MTDSGPDDSDREGIVSEPGADDPRAAHWGTFVQVLLNTGVAGLVTNFLWFAVVFWVYLETRSILATGILGGAFMLLIAVCSMWFGSLVDRHRKRSVMLASAWFSTVAFVIGTSMYVTIPESALLDLGGPWFWVFTLILLAGCVVELLRGLALSTTVTLLVPTERHANANGLVGTVQGLSFIVTSVFSGISIGLLGMGTTMMIAVVATLIPVIHLHLLKIPEPEIARDPSRSAIDFRGGMAALLAVPGLIGLVVFTTFNNFTSGTYMALLDPYGLEMFSVEMWGIVFGIAGTGFLVGGAIVSKFGLGRNPIRTMLLLVVLLGLFGASATIREWPILFLAGIWGFMLLMPAIEAAEQTVIQRVVPYEKQGRVFGLAMTFEAAAAPITSFLIAPIAEFWVVPYMREGPGEEAWAWVLGEGDTRGIALIFLWAGIITSVVAAAALLTPTYRRLVRSFSSANTPTLEG